MLLKTTLRERDHQDTVCRRHSHTHNRSHQCGNAQRRVRQEQEDHDARERGRQRCNDDKGIDPALEVHHDQQVDQHDREGKSTQQPDV